MKKQLIYLENGPNKVKMLYGKYKHNAVNEMMNLLLEERANMVKASVF